MPGDSFSEPEVYSMDSEDAESDNGSVAKLLNCWGIEIGS